MIDKIKTNYYTYEKRLINLARRRGFVWENIGQTNDNYKFNIYKIILAENKKINQTICLVGGIHGTEISGPLGILDFLSSYDKKILSNTRLIIFPLINPYGFHHKKDLNANKINLNRNFYYGHLQDEQRILYQQLKKEKVDIFCSFHEDDVQNDFYIYAFGEKNKEQAALLQAIKKQVSSYVKILDKKSIYKRVAKEGVIFDIKDGSFEHFMYRKGSKSSFCMEVPDKLGIKNRRLVVLGIIKNILKFKYKK